MSARIGKQDIINLADKVWNSRNETEVDKLKYRRMYIAGIKRFFKEADKKEKKNLKNQLKLEIWEYISQYAF